MPLHIIGGPSRTLRLERYRESTSNYSISLPLELWSEVCSYLTPEDARSIVEASEITALPTKELDSFMGLATAASYFLTRNVTLGGRFTFEETVSWLRSYVEGSKVARLEMTLPHGWTACGTGQRYKESTAIVKLIVHNFTRLQSLAWNVDDLPLSSAHIQLLASLDSLKECSLSVVPCTDLRPLTRLVNLGSLSISAPWHNLGGDSQSSLARLFFSDAPSFQVTRLRFAMSLQPRSTWNGTNMTTLSMSPPSNFSADSLQLLNTMFPLLRNLKFNGLDLCENSLQEIDVRPFLHLDRLEFGFVSMKPLQTPRKMHLPPPLKTLEITAIGECPIPMLFTLPSSLISLRVALPKSDTLGTINSLLSAIVSSGSASHLTSLDLSLPGGQKFIPPLVKFEKLETFRFSNVCNTRGDLRDCLVALEAFTSLHVDTLKTLSIHPFCNYTSKDVLVYNNMQSEWDASKLGDVLRRCSLSHVHLFLPSPTLFESIFGGVDWDDLTSLSMKFVYRCDNLKANNTAWVDILSQMKSVRQLVCDHLLVKKEKDFISQVAEVMPMLDSVIMEMGRKPHTYDIRRHPFTKEIWSIGNPKERWYHDEFSV